MVDLFPWWQTYAILMVFNEFNILTESKGILVNSLEENAITRVVLPHSLQTLTQ